MKKLTRIIFSIVILAALYTLFSLFTTNHGTDRHLLDKNDNADETSINLTLSSKLSNNGGDDLNETHVDLKSFGYFGSHISVSGDIMVASIELNTYGYGVIYIFEKDANGVWVKTAELGENGILAHGASTAGGGYTWNNAEALGAFRSVGSLSLDSDVLAVASEGYGTVYLFERNSDASWRKILRITSEIRNKEAVAEGDTTPHLSVVHTPTPYSGSKYPRSFGTSVSLDGNMLAVGADQDDDGGPTTGAVYLFEKIKGEWSQVLKISDNDGGEGKLAIDLDSDDFFGTDVALSGNRLAVGASWDDDGGDDKGAVYLFEKIRGEWSQVLKISDNDGGPGLLAIKHKNTRFGASVALSDDLLAIGENMEDMVFILKKMGTTWKQARVISGRESGNNIFKVDLVNNIPGGSIYSGFGSSISFSNNTLMIGSSEEDEGQQASGAVYIFNLDI